VAEHFVDDVLLGSVAADAEAADFGEAGLGFFEDGGPGEEFRDGGMVGGRGFVRREK
jgi:hypothetical protein